MIRPVVAVLITAAVGIAAPQPAPIGAACNYGHGGTPIPQTVPVPKPTS